jgi:protein-arginine kinase activator protein McsA
VLSKNERSIIKKVKTKGRNEVGKFLEESQQILTAKMNLIARLYALTSEIAKENKITYETTVDILRECVNE